MEVKRRDRKLIEGLAQNGVRTDGVLYIERAVTFRSADTKGTGTLVITPEEIVLKSSTDLLRLSSDSVRELSVKQGPLFSKIFFTVDSEDAQTEFEFRIASDGVDTVLTHCSAITGLAKPEIKETLEQRMNSFGDTVSSALEEATIAAYTRHAVKHGGPPHPKVQERRQSDLKRLEAAYKTALLELQRTKSDQARISAITAGRDFSAQARLVHTSDLTITVYDEARIQTDIIAYGTGSPTNSDPPTMTGQPAAWRPDPSGRNEHRYWDGEFWTEHVANQGVAGIDPT